jgi:hypothetical protein
VTDPSAPGAARLRLRAEDAEDLAVVSACLQDALVAVRDLAYDPGQQTFMLIANRFRWEGCGGMPETAALFERTLCGVAFGGIGGVAYRGFHRSEEDRILSLLAIRPVSEEADGDAHRPAAAVEPHIAIDFEFAGDAKIRLSASAIRCVASDFGEPWPTWWQPAHALDETG